MAAPGNSLRRTKSHKKRLYQHHRPEVALLACSVFERENAPLARGSSHIAEMRLFETGLHGLPEKLRIPLQAKLDQLDARQDIEAILLVCGLCGRGTAGLAPDDMIMCSEPFAPDPPNA